MNINTILKKEGIQIKSKLDRTQVDKIATIIAQKICETFPEHNLNVTDIFSALSRLDMYIAQMPADSAVAKYFYKNNSIYFSDKMNLDTLDTLAIHECIHAIQEIKTPRGKLLKLGLYDVTTNKGQGMNEAAVQLMAVKATDTKIDNVKYYNMDFYTPSPLFYPIETALMNQIMYFTGSYPLFHSTLHSNLVFKNTLIAKSSEKIYADIETNFDLLIHYENLLSVYSSELANYSEKQSFNKVKKLNEKIDTLKTQILDTTLATQNLIIEHCFHGEFDTIRDASSLNHFQQKLYEFNELLISADSYDFYHSFYHEMMQKLEEKRELIRQHGVLNYLNDLQTELLDLERDHFGLKFFHRLFDKLKLLFEETVRDKNHSEF